MMQSLEIFDPNGIIYFNQSIYSKQPLAIEVQLENILFTDRFN